MVKCYKNSFGGKASYEDNFIAFRTYDDEYHQIALAGIPKCGPKVCPTLPDWSISLSAFDTLTDLAAAYRQRKQL
jgi:hypothetical protein